MRKKLLSLILTLCMVMPLFPVISFAERSDNYITIAGRTLDSTTPYWINGRSVAQASVTTPGVFNAYFEEDLEKITLHLKDAQISSTGYGIESNNDKDLTIICEGTNTITGGLSGIDAKGKLLISGSGSLDIKGETQHGIIANKTVTISNDGNLSIEGKQTGINAFGDVDNKIDINTKGDINIKGNERPGIANSAGGISIITHNGSVKVSSQNDSGVYSQGDGAITIKGNKGVEINSVESYGIVAENVSSTIIESEQGSVSITGKKSGLWLTNSDIKIKALNNVDITGTDRHGIFSGKKIDITAGQNITINSTNYDGIYIQGADDVILYAGGNLVVKPSITIQSGGRVYLAGTVAAGETLNIYNNTFIPKGKTLTNNGTINVLNDRIFTIDGILLGNGTITPKPINPTDPVTPGPVIPGPVTPGPGTTNPGGSNSGGNNSGGSSSKDKTPVVVSPTIPESIKNTQRAIENLSNEQKQEIKQNLQEFMPYTLLDKQGITADLLKLLTKDRFTKEELETLAKQPELLKDLGVDISLLSTIATLKPIENPQFKDVPDDFWAAESINKAAKLGITVGVGDDKFSPKEPLKVTDTFTFLNRVLLMNGITENTLPRSTVEKYITDKNNWAFMDMASIGAKLSENTLKTISELGDKPISRELLAQVIYELTKGKLEQSYELIAFTDITNPDYEEAINYCVSVGLLRGTSKDTMSPEKELTRAELMTVLIKLTEKLN